MEKKLKAPKRWRISIDDGYVEYYYDVDINGSYSIAAVEKAIRKTIGYRAGRARMRRNWNRI